MVSGKKEKVITTDGQQTIFMRLFRALLQSPARISILGFATLVSMGTLLLMLPTASTAERLGFINAVFTATSATCVTGLVVVDTGTAFSLFGQLVILLLIQVGGLGIMTLSTLILMVAGRRPSLAGRMVIQDTFTHGEEQSLFSILRNVVIFTFVIEGLGIALMFFNFFPGRQIGDTLYLSVFHSVSAFCNAGFSIFSDSFMRYRDNWVLNLGICCLIILGGIGFPVLSELKRQFPYNGRTWSRLSLHSKLVLSVTAILLIGGSFLFILMEWRNTLAPLSQTDRFLAGFFQVVTARTAGFNTLPVKEMTNESLFFLLLLMFIGASPGSCGGGIKTTTLACLALLGVSRLRGKARPQLFRRTISEGSVGKAVSIVMTSLFLIVTATLLLLMTELGDTPHLESRGIFLELLFEVVSAFGTVGLSTGVTQGLSSAGKLIVTFVMFIGRLGPLVIAISVTRPTSRYYYAEESIMIG